MQLPPITLTWLSNSPREHRSCENNLAEDSSVFPRLQGGHVGAPARRAAAKAAPPAAAATPRLRLARSCPMRCEYARCFHCRSEQRFALMCGRRSLRWSVAFERSALGCSLFSEDAFTNTEHPKLAYNTTAATNPRALERIVRCCRQSAVRILHWQC